MLNIISDSSDLSGSRLNTLWCLWHMQTHQQQSGPGERSNWRWKESTPSGPLFFFQRVICTVLKIILPPVWVSFLASPSLLLLIALSSKAPFPLFTALVLSQSLSVIISVSLSPLAILQGLKSTSAAVESKRGWKRMGERERKKAEQNRANQWWKGRAARCVCACACVCARVWSMQYLYVAGSGRERQREREKHRLQLQTETETGQS